MNIERIESILARFPARSAWDRGVRDTARDLLEYLELADDQPITEKALLDDARDWSEWSYGGCGCIYDSEIAERFCSPSDLKRTHNGLHAPNRRESWLDVQARAARQAARRILVAQRGCTSTTTTE